MEEGRGDEGGRERVQERKEGGERAIFEGWMRFKETRGKIGKR